MNRTDLTITEKGEAYRKGDRAISPGAMLTLELIARFPGLDQDKLRAIYVAILREMPMDDALVYVKSGELEKAVQEARRE